MEEAVLYVVENNIATITMNRPKSLNSMNDGLIDGLHAALDISSLALCTPIAFGRKYKPLFVQAVI